MSKLTFDEAMDKIADERYINADDVRADALRRVVWIAEWHIPGCVSESRSVCTSKADAVDAACRMAETGNGTPRGMVTALRKHGRFDCRTEMYGTVINTVSKCQLADLF